MYTLNEEPKEGEGLEPENGENLSLKVGMTFRPILTP